MNITTRTCRKWHQALKAAQSALFFIADGGRPTHALLAIENYRRLAQPQRNIVDALAMPHAPDGDFEPPGLSIVINPAHQA
ncbi:type II toxin-antitoxin system Phd/YefM family antitoxin [Methylorubrum suomiense]|uniref:Prevent-host-death family protein n=1 Tax=Methylorubrum suomiense TaxID=144191 RepID=A0ABQ4UYF1_9HYPH|nr:MULTISPECIES: type II toxin-antitoxin system Phd/YefM family antitoxin [Methylobacteriaceae]GJE76433.1 hypothetical protein BGCPKDLD_3025 [Methylorubrum suomiense]